LQATRPSPSASEPVLWSLDLSLFFCSLAGYRLIIEKKSAGTDADAIAALTRNAYPEHPRTAHDDDVPTKDEALHMAAKFAKLADLLRKPKLPT
jgi:hypothetical protein